MKNKLVYLTTIMLLILIFTGCSRSAFPSPEVMKQETQGFKLPRLPKDGTAIVYVVRPEIFGTLIKFNVFLDDTQAHSEMGFTNGKEYIYFLVKPGTHTLYSDAENLAAITFRAEEKDIIFIEQEEKTGFLYARNNLHKDYSYLEGKYRVKTLNQGTIYKTSK